MKVSLIKKTTYIEITCCSTHHFEKKVLEGLSGLLFSPLGLNKYEP